MLAPRGVESLKACAAEYGYSFAFDGATIASGMKIPASKRFVTEGSSKGTSVVSWSLRKLPLPDVPVRQWAPTTTLPSAATRSSGGIIGRWTPIVGGAMAVIDAVAVGLCASTYEQLRAR